MKINRKKRQLLLRLPEELVEFLKRKANNEGLLVTRFCEKYLGLMQFLDLHPNIGQIRTSQAKKRMLIIPASQYDQMYGATATFREGRRLGLEWAPLLEDLSIEDTLAIFSKFGWGIFEFQAENERIIHSNPPISSSEFIRGLIEGLTGLNLQTLSTNRDVFIYKILI